MLWQAFKIESAASMVHQQLDGQSHITQVQTVYKSVPNSPIASTVLCLKSWQRDILLYTAGAPRNATMNAAASTQHHHHM